MSNDNNPEGRVFGLTLLQLMAAISALGIVLVVVINYFF